MVFGPPWTQHDASEPERIDADLLLPAVREAAERLVADLRRAEELTAAWSDKALSDALADDALSRCMAFLSATGYWGEANRLPSSELWRIAGALLERGWLQQRARLKPRGYAGDFEMLARIYEQTCCEDPLGRAFDRYFLRQAAPQAVRARTEQTAAALAAECLRRPAEALRVVSVGSGPALDVAAALAMLPSQRRATVRVTLLDLDPDALEFARRRLHPLMSGESLRCQRANLFRLPKTAQRAPLLGTPDLLVCAGLFDYLDDEAATAMLDLFWQRLAPGGLLLVGNFAPHNPTRAYMEWIGNWYLLYRMPGQLEQLAIRAGIPRGRLTISSERLGVDLFLVARKG